ncbi:MAG: hypothetical protein RLZZ28_861 [Bacteroidota bacterium]|jgi:anti-sigma factor ChrR (cupin superfamily)
MKLIMISCQEATYLISKKEEKKLRWFEKIKLSAHLMLCSFCRKFEKQINLIIKQVQNNEFSATLSDETKGKIKTALKEQTEA